MPYGLQVFDDNGNLQFDSDMPTYFLRKTGTCSPINTTPESNYMRVPGALTYPGALVGFTEPNYGYAVGFDLNGSTTGVDYWSFVTDAPPSVVFNYYIFVRSDTVPAVNFGFETYDTSSNRTFSAAQRPMRNKAVLGATSATEVAIPSGKVYGWCPTNWGGYNMYGDSDTGEPDSYYHDFSAYCAANGYIAGVPGNIITARSVPIPGGRGTVIGPRPPDSNQFDIPAKFFVFDATGIPIGTTFW